MVCDLPCGIEVEEGGGATVRGADIEVEREDMAMSRAFEVCLIYK